MAVKEYLPGVQASPLAIHRTSTSPTNVCA